MKCKQLRGTCLLGDKCNKKIIDTFIFEIAFKLKTLFSESLKF